MKPFAVFDAAIQGGNQSTGGLVFETTLQRAGCALRARRSRRTAAVAEGGVAADRGECGGVRREVARREEGRVRRHRCERQGAGVRHSLSERRERVRRRLLQDAVREVWRQAHASWRSCSPYPPGISQADATAQAQEQMPTLMARLKNGGVTTVIDVLDHALRPPTGDASRHRRRILPRVDHRERRPRRRRTRSPQICRSSCAAPTRSRWRTH